eukprot:393962-Prymnesium_polylepis.1
MTARTSTTTASQAATCHPVTSGAACTPGNAVASTSARGLVSSAAAGSCTISQSGGIGKLTARRHSTS